MLDRFVLTAGILGAWIISGIVERLLKRRRGDNLPRGSVTAKRQRKTESSPGPGTTWSKFGVALAMGGNIVGLLGVLGVSLFNLWSAVAPYIAIDLPCWLNWIGLIGFWAHLGWGLSVYYYNVNYTPLFQPMPGTLVLATGGPYRLVRHPMYMGYFALTGFFFLMTGVWLVAISAMGWLALPAQTRDEDRALGLRFGAAYSAYARRTGKYFPRIRRRHSL
jgi:protein-S-isoprenylcysteine O-methyltransferase Ste14